MKMRSHRRLIISSLAPKALETAYSRTRSHPMIQAASSPSVTYAYVYALPARQTERTVHLRRR